MIHINNNPVGSPVPGTGSALSFGNQTAAGTYTVLATYSGSPCQQLMQGAAVIGIAPQPTPGLTNNGPLTCSITSVALTASGGSTYQFSPGAVPVGNAATATVSSAGLYSVTVTSNGCSAVASTSVGQDNSAPSASLVSSGTLSCAVTSVTLTASPSGQSYTFSGPGLVSQSGNTAIVNASGLYSVTVMSANGCSSVASTSVSQDNTAPVDSLISSGSLTCSVTSVTLTASPNGQTYLFSGPSVVSHNGNTALVNAAGTYSVTVVSTNGCSSVASVSVSQDNTAPTASISPSSATLSCASPSVSLTAIGTGSVRWSTGETTPVISVTTAATYSVTLISAHGCTAVASTSVSQDDTAPTASLVSSGSLTCSVTSVTLTANPAGLSYVFTGPGVVSQNGNTAIVNTAGTYSVTVVSANGCSAVASVSVIQDQTAPVASLVSSGSLTCSVTSVTLTANPNGLTYQFSSGATQVGSSNHAVVNASGTYSVTVLSGNGCSAVASVSVSGDQSLPTVSISPSSATLSCASSSVSLTAVGAGNVLWSTGSTDRVITVTTAGTYSVTLTSANGCSASASAVIDGYQSAPTASLVSSGSLTCAVASVTLTASPTGLSYVFSGPGVISSTGNTAVVNAAGTYSVTVTNGTTGCASTTSITISRDASPPVATISASPSSTLTCAQTSLTLTANASGGSGYTYAFSSGASQLGNTNQATVTQTGSYSVTVTSATGCSVVATVTVSSSTSVATPNFATRGNQAIADGLISMTVVQNTASIMFNATNCSGTLNWSGNGQTGTTTLNAPTSATGVFVYQATCTVGSCVSSPASVTVTITPANTAPVATANANQTATVGQPFTYTANAFTDAETPNSLIYTASFNPANSLTFNPATRVIQGTPMNTGVTSVTITATDPGGLSASTTFTITVLPVPVVTNLTVLSRDPENGNLNTNTIKPYLLLQNDGTEAIPYGELTVRYYLTLENPQPLRFDINYAQMGNDKIHLRYVPLSPARQGASGYIEFSFDGSAGSLAPMSNAVIQDLINKQDYTSFFQGDDYSYVNNANFAANSHITAYRNGVLVYGVEPLPAGPPAPLGLTLTADPAVLLSTGNTTLTANVSGGTGPYSYAFSGPGTIQPNGNTANVSNLTAGVQTFTVVVTDATTPVNQTIAATVSVTVTTPANQLPVATANVNQTATVGQMVTYTVNAFTDDTPNSLTYTASINPANGLTLNPATRVIQGTPLTTGVSSVTITATDPGGLSASTVFTITVNAVPVAPTALTLTASASPATILATGTTTLTASVSGGTPGYTYVFSGPGTIAPTGNTAQVANLPAGVQTFTVTVTDASQPNLQTISTTVSVTVTAPANQPPVASSNTNQTATVGVNFTYTANAFGDETPGSLTYTASVNPANGFTFNPATRMIQGNPQTAGVSSVTITATDPGGLSASTVFTITVLPAPVVTDRLTVYSRDPDNGQLNTNTLKPYLQLQNEGSIPIPYGELTVRYWLTVENPAPFRYEINYAQLGSDKVHLNYVPISPARQGASGYIEFSFDGAAGSLAANSNSGPIQDLINKQDYSYFNQGDDYSYVNNPNFTPNPHITAYRNGALIYGTEPSVGTRVAADGADARWTVQVLGNPVEGLLVVAITGAEGEQVNLSLVDESGHGVSRRPVVPTTGRHQEVFDVSGQGAGLLLLRAESATHQQTLKILKR